MPHKWIFIQVDFFGRARPLPIASNRGQRLTRFLHKSILDCPAPHKEINVFVHSSRFSNNWMWPMCVVSTLLCAHTLYTLYLPNLVTTCSYNSSTVALKRSLSRCDGCIINVKPNRTALSLSLSFYLSSVTGSGP